MTASSLDRGGPTGGEGLPRKLLVTSGIARLDPRGLRTFREAGFELLEHYELSGTDDEQALGDALEGVWGAVAGTEQYSQSLLQRCHALRVVARCGVGTDAIDIDAASDRGVAVLSTPGTNVEAVADFTLALMLACLRGLRRADAAVRSGRWRQRVSGGDLAGATVGVVGLGAIGQAVARRLRGFGCRILGVDPFADPSACVGLGVELIELLDALPQLDVLTIHVPLTDYTRGMFSEREFLLLPRGAVLVNTSRGGIVDEEALLAGLWEGRVATAGLDVFAREPLPPDDPIMQADGVLLSGHVASFTQRSVETTLDMTLEGLLTLQSGRVPANCINAERLLGIWRAQ